MRGNSNWHGTGTIVSILAAFVSLAAVIWTTNLH